MKTVFADPKTDVIFKKLFGQKAHQHLLVELLNSLLELEGKHRIVDVEYLTPEQVPPRHDLKLSMLDVKCTDASGTHYVVEMQVIAVEGFQKRVVYNACKAYVLQLGAGDDYPQLSGVIAVTLCNFVLWPQKDHSDDYKVPMLSRWRMQEQHGGERWPRRKCSTCSWSCRSIKRTRSRRLPSRSGRISFARRGVWNGFPKCFRRLRMPRRWK